MIYLTGDTHGTFTRIGHFCKEHNTSREDVLIILGDAGFNFGGGARDIVKKHKAAQFPITLLCIHGNHEQRPATLPKYREKLWRGGVVYVEEEYPNLLFAKDGEVYDLEGRQAIAIGGAYSVDWIYRMPGRSWWADEQPSAAIKQRVEQQLAERNWKIDVVLSHTIPKKYEPTEVFLPGLDQSQVDKSTERWLDDLEDKLNYANWFCGHFHTSKEIRGTGVRILYEDYATL